MNIALHKNARTTPAVCAEIAPSGDASERELSRRCGVTGATIYKWKARDSTADRFRTTHRLQTTFTPAQEAVVVELRRTLLLPLDYLLAVGAGGSCAPTCPARAWTAVCAAMAWGSLATLKPAEPKEPHKSFKACKPGYLHMDIKYLPQMQDERSRRYLFVAIDRATRWVYVAIKGNKSAASAKSFLAALHKACPTRITQLLTDNAKEFHRPLLCLAAARAQRPARVRPAVQSAGHRASADSAQNTPDQRQG